VACVASAAHGVTVPVQVVDVDCQLHPCCSVQLLSVES
jgi:hypothetical protein